MYFTIIIDNYLFNNILDIINNIFIHEINNI